MSESLNCNFYKYTGDPRTANKALGNVIYTCSSIQPLEALNDLDIKLIIDYPDNTSGKPALMDCNYVAIDNKYYKITSKDRLTARGLAIYATIDGLLTYWNEVKECPSIVERSTVKYNSEINDPQYPVNQRLDVEVKSVCDLGDDDEMIFYYIE